MEAFGPSHKAICFLYIFYMKKILAFLFGFLLSGVSHSMPAYPKWITIDVNGQKRLIRLFGDEKSKRAETEDGYTIIQNEKGKWCYAMLGQDSIPQPSMWELGNEEFHNSSFMKFLEQTPKHIVTTQKRVEALAARQNSKAAIGTRRMLIILMSYQNLPFVKSKSDYEKLFNEEGYSEDHAQGSVRDFYLASSYGQLELTSDIYGPYTASRNMEFYGGNSGMNNGPDANAYGLFEEAITNVAREADLSLYDGDGDGFIDNVHIIFAGYGEEAGASSNAIWSHEATFYRPYEIQGLKIDRYSCAPELRGNSGNGISRIGPHCHEIGHALGAMDYYDTDYSTNGEFLGTGKWDVMASGSWNNEGITPADFNPYVKAYDFGWIRPGALPLGDVTIQPSSSGAENYYILKSAEYGDYYLLENRIKGNREDGLPGEGLLLFHIHSDIANAGNEINATAPQKCYAVCASSRTPIPGNTPASYGDINTDGCPFPGRTGNVSFGQNSIPRAFYWEDSTCGIEINNIALTSNGDVTLTNNSVGASVEPVNMQSVFFEGFENEGHLAIPSASSWQIEDNPENTMTYIDKPVAFEGVKSLQLSAKESASDITDSIEFVCAPLNSERKRLKISVASLYLRFNKPNIIRVCYRESNDPTWRSAEISSTENNHWRQSYIELPNNVDVRFRIVGTAYAGSIVAIDNIEIEQEIVDESAHICAVGSYQSTPNTIYSIDGVKRKNVSKGINILRQSDGTARKVVFPPGRL